MRTVTNRRSSNSNGDGISNHTSRDDRAINRRALYHRFHDQIRYPRSQRGAYTPGEDNRSPRGRAYASRRLERIRYSRRPADRPAGRNHHPPAPISIISKSRLPFARYNPTIRNIALVACSVGAEIWSREIATGKNAKTARSLDRAITRLVPPDCLVSPVPARAFLAMKQRREKKNRRSGMRMRTRKGGESF